MPPFRMNIHIMRDSLRFLAVPFTVVIGTCVCFDALAQQQGRPTRPGVTTQPVQAQPQQQAQRPPQGNGRPPVNNGLSIPAEKVNPPAPVEPLDPELESLLKQWELKSAQIKTLNGVHERTVYNLVFETDERSTGKFFLETPDKGRIDLKGVKPGRDDKSERIGTKSGRPFRIEEGRAERWVCSGQEILAIDDDEKTYQVMPLPKEAQGQNIVHSPLPFLFGMKAAEAKARYDFVLQKNTKEQAYLIINPKLDSDKQNYSQARVLLEKVNYLPIAVKLYDPSSNLETVYKFKSIKINEGPGILGGIFGEKDPFHPKLTGHKLSLTSTEEPNGPQQNTRPVQPASNRQVAPAPTQPPRIGTQPRPNSNK